ncbi:MAG TPA: hypothetical protein VKA08_02855 [Balneolales bacterium]|nr:hypothetical protein [Balneolales bacterium]
MLAATHKRRSIRDALFTDWSAVWYELGVWLVPGVLSKLSAAADRMLAPDVQG